MGEKAFLLKKINIPVKSQRKKLSPIFDLQVTKKNFNN